MLRFVSVLARVSFVFVGLSLLTLQGSVRGQNVAPGELDASLRVMHADGAIDAATTVESARTVFVGRVIEPDGTPAVGAVVVTSAGGQAVTDAQGAFSLEVDLPADAKSVRVTAAMGSGTGSLVGGAQVGGLTGWGMTSAGTLILEGAGTCQPSWLPTFGGQPGVNANIYAVTVFDDGGGPALYAGGTFTTAGGVAANSIAKWNGTSWSALGSGMAGGVFGPFVGVLAVFDDGSGPALIAGGSFSTAGDVPANNLAKWNGTSWSALGSGMGGSIPWVAALTVFDGDSGPALYAGGHFTAIDSGDSYLAKWGGCSATVSPWTNLGSSLPGVSGAPLLEGSGTMEAGSQNVLDLSNAAPSAVAILFAAPSSLPAPFKGGIVLPDPIYPPTYGMTNASGTIRFRFILPAGMPSGTQAWVQWGIEDAAAVKGVSLSNVVMGVTP
jgi:hypothetical protein